MARFLTTKVQISGYRMLWRRLEQAFTRRDVRLLASPFTAHNTAFSIGIGVAAIIPLAALIMSFFSPQPARNEATIIATKSGSRYVMFQDALHPVTNLASARLIAGGAEEVRVVKDSEVEKSPRGLLMGIPAAPDAMTPRDGDKSQWTVCSQYDTATALDLTQEQNARTLVIAGEDPTVDDAVALSDQEALLVSEPGNHTGRKLWLLFRGERTEIKPAARALQATLGLDSTATDNAAVVSDALLDAIPVREPLAKPVIDKESSPSKALPKHRIGSILISDGVGDQRSFLVLDSGLQQISPFVAELMVNSGSTVVNDVSPMEVSQAPVAQGFDFSRYPTSTPSLSTASTICYGWEKDANADSSSSIFARQTVPLSSEQRSRIVALLPARGNSPQTDFFYTSPGKGWLVEVTGQSSSSLAQEQLWWVSDAGVRYAISGDDNNSEADALKALGLNTTKPHRAPWSVLRLLPEGNALSIDAAKVVHEMIVPEMAQSPVTVVKGMN